MGYLRFGLILTVIYYHLAGKMIAGSIAVYGFFILSGYLVTLISAEIYHEGWRGRALFLANRVTRVWPTYLVCLGLSLAAMYAVGFTTAAYHPEYKLPTSPVGWLVQFTIVGLSDFTGGRYPARILLPAWSLSTELCYYLVIGLITGRSKFLTLAGFIVTLLISAWLAWNNYPFSYFYFSIEGTGLAFFIGAMFYHFRAELARFAIGNTPLLLALALVTLYAPELFGAPHKSMIVLYGSALILGYVVMCLHLLSNLSRPKRIEQFLADITYPMFLLHWPIGALICYLWLGAYQRTPEVFMLTLPATLLAGAAMVFIVEMPMKRLRHVFRRRAIKLLRNNS